MYRALWLLSLLPLTATAETYIDIGLLASTNRYNHEGRNPLFQIRGGYEHRITERQSVLVEAEHHCALLQGSPFEGKDERQNNSVGLFYRYRWRK